MASALIKTAVCSSVSTGVVVHVCGRLDGIRSALVTALYPYVAVASPPLIEIVSVSIPEPVLVGTSVDVPSVASIVSMLPVQGVKQVLSCSWSVASAIGGFARRAFGYEVVRFTVFDALAGGVYWLYGSRKEVIKKIRVCTVGMLPESLVAGSSVMEMGTVPKCQVALAYLHEGQYHAVGSGIRCENHLITPAHTLAHDHDFFMIGISAGVTVAVKIEGPRIDMAADVIAISVTEDVWARLGVARVKMVPLNQKASVTITSSCARKYTIGALTPGRTLGRANYNASTLPGFSGAAYANGSNTLAMHTNGGGDQGGYEILYLYTIRIIILIII